MKKLFVILSCSILASACGNSGDKTAASKDSASAGAPTSTSNDKGLELIATSDCTTCHRLDKSSTTGATIGPAYSEVAAKYSPAADSTFDRIVKKIITGGSGLWGAVPMTPHPAIPEADVREMVKYILSLKK
jgi:cytochrome c